MTRVGLPLSTAAVTPLPTEGCQTFQAQFALGDALLAVLDHLLVILLLPFIFNELWLVLFKCHLGVKKSFISGLMKQHISAFPKQQISIF